MINSRWHLYSLEKPEEDGVYRVRLTKRNDLLSSPIEYIGIRERRMDHKDPYVNRRLCSICMGI